MTALPHIEYFLGANAPTGFYSLYSHLLPPEQARAIYILKGGPGCGKSTLMRTVAARMEQEGLETEYILCSGDPDSLDALIVPRLGVAIVDGTAPHVVEPKYPGAVERYVNVGDCYDKNALWDLRGEIMSCMAGYKGCYRRAYRCLGALRPALPVSLRQAGQTGPGHSPSGASKGKGHRNGRGPSAVSGGCDPPGPCLPLLHRRRPMLPDLRADRQLRAGP